MLLRACIKIQFVSFIMLKIETENRRIEKIQISVESFQRSSFKLSSIFEQQLICIPNSSSIN